MTKTPRRTPDARRFEQISYSEVLEKRLRVMDATAVALCRDNQMPMIVFNMAGDGHILKVVRGESIGTLVVAKDRAQPLH